MIVLGAVGFSNTGKTTTMAVLTRFLTREKGFKVFVAKDIHKEGVQFDTPGKDTWIYRENGAAFVLGRTLEDAAIFLPLPVTYDSMQEIADKLGVDILLVEGFKQECDCPRILCVKSLEEVSEWDLEQVICISGIVSAQLGVPSVHEGIPIFNPLTDPEPFLAFVEGQISKIT